MKKTLFFLLFAFIVSGNTGFAQNRSSGNTFTIGKKTFEINYAFILRTQVDTSLIMSNVPVEDFYSEEAVVITVHNIAFDKNKEKQVFTYLDRQDRAYSPELNCNALFVREPGHSFYYLPCVVGEVVLTQKEENYVIDCRVAFRDGEKAKGHYVGNLVIYTEEEFYNLRGLDNPVEVETVIEAIEEETVAESLGNGVGYVKNGKTKTSIYNCRFDGYSLTFWGSSGEGAFYISDEMWLKENKTYTYSKEETKDHFYGFDYYSQDGYISERCKSGTLKVKKLDDIRYQFNFKVELEDGQKLKGFYEGECRVDIIEIEIVYEEEIEEIEIEEIVDHPLDSIKQGFSGIETDLAATGKENYLSFGNARKGYALVQASVVKMPYSDTDILLLTGDSLPVWRDKMLSFEDSTLVMPAVIVRIPKEGEQYPEKPFFYKDEYEDDFNAKFHFPEASTYFATRNRLDLFTYCMDGLINIVKTGDSTYAFDFTLLYHDSIYIMGNYTGKLREDPLAKNVLDYLGYDYNAYPYELPVETLENPFPGFDFDSVTIANGFTVNGQPAIATPFVEVVVSGDDTGTVLCFSTTNSAQPGLSSRTNIFTLLQKIDQLEDEQIWYYDESKKYEHDFTNGLHGALFVDSTTDTTTFGTFRYAALRIRKTGDRYQFVYRTQTGDDIYTGSYEGEIALTDVKNLANTSSKPDTVAGKGRFVLNKKKAFTQSMMYQLDPDLFGDADNYLFFMLTDAGFSSLYSLLPFSNLVMFAVYAEDGKIPEGKFPLGAIKGMMRGENNAQKGIAAAVLCIENPDIFLNEPEDAAKGNVDIRKNGDVYHIRYDMKLDTGKKIRGEYRGKLNIMQIKQ